MADRSKIKSALIAAGHEVSKDFDSKMEADPKFVERVRTSLKGLGHDVPDSATFYQKYGSVPVAAPARVDAPRTLISPDAFGGGLRLQAPSRTQKAARLRGLAAEHRADAENLMESNSGLSTSEILFPRTVAASEAGLSMPRKAVAGGLDAMSAPFRAMASLPSSIGDDMTFGEAMASTGAPRNAEGAEAFAQDVVRDPLNALFLSGRLAGKATRGVANKIAPATTAKIAKLVQSVANLESKGKLGYTAAKALEGTAKIGVPVASVNVASDYGAGVDDPNQFIADIVTGLGSGAALGTAIPAAGKGLKLIGSGTMKIADRVPNPLAPKNKVAMALRNADSKGEALNYDEVAGVLTEPTIGAIVRRVSEQIPSSPMFVTAQKLLRELMKPAPMAKKGQEAADLEEVLARPEMFDQMTSYRDLVGGVHRMAKRNLDKIDNMSREVWNPTFEAYETQRNLFNDAVRESQRYDSRALQYASELLGGPGQPEVAKRMPGMKMVDVAKAAKEGFDQTLRNQEATAKPRDLYKAVKDQLMIFGTPSDRSVVRDLESNIPYKLADEMTIADAHKAKSNQYKVAYKSGVPDAMTPVRQQAASIVGRAHNEVLENMIKNLVEDVKARKPLAAPQLNPSRAQLRDAKETKQLNELFADMEEELPVALPNRPIYDLQKQYLNDERAAPTVDEVIEALFKDPTNASVRDYGRNKIVQTGSEVRAQDEIESYVKDRKDDFVAERAAMSRRAKANGKPPLPPMRPEQWTELENKFRAEIEGEVYMGDDAIEQYAPAIREEAEIKADDIVRQTVDQWKRDRVEPWTASLPKYKEASKNLDEKLQDVRRADRVLAPWYKAEAALQRAATSGGNRYSYSPGDAMLPIAGGLAGYGLASLPGGMDPETGAAIGAAVGMGKPVIKYGLRTPALPKAIRDIGRISDAMSRDVAKTGGVYSIDQIIEAVLSGKNQGNDGITTPDSTAVRVAEKKGKK